MKRRDKGQVLVLVALAIFVLLGFAALGIDVGFMYNVRHELQRSADAGALAGASAFTTGNWNDTSMALDHPRGIANARAREFASKDKVVQTTLDPASEVAVSFDFTPPRPDHIEVVTSRTADLFFARIFGMSNRLITARAVAKASVAGPPVSVNCVKPWAITYPWLDGPQTVPGQGNKPPTTSPPNDYYDPGEQVYKDCNNGIGLCAGLRVTLKSGSPSQPNPVNAQQSVPGHFFIMQGNEGNIFHGANDMRTYIRDGCYPMDMTKRVDLMTGGKMGPTVQGVQDLINGDPGSHWDTAANLPTSTDYPNNVAGDWMKSPRVVRVVIYDPSVNDIGTGTKQYIEVGYSLAGFWIEECGEQGKEGWVIGRYIPGTAFGGSGPPGPVTGTEVKVIALVE
jgi:hypothetical protein